MKKVYKSILGVSAATVIAAATLSPVMVNAWGDSAGGRKSYTTAQAKELGDTITFNSFTDGKIGDEKNFVGAKVAGTNPTTWNADTIKVKDGETYTIRLYVHNNNLYGTKNTAKNVKATFSIPTSIAKSHTIVGYLDSSNATPNRYWDEVTLAADDNIYLEYVFGSAKYTNDKMGTVTLPDEVITSGAKLGYEKLDGNIPGCFEYDGVVTIDVKVHSSVAAKVSKKVRIKGTKAWSESVEAKIGDEVEYQIEFVNLLNEQVRDVILRDALPTNVEYVKDSTYFFSSNYPDGMLVKDNNLTTTGINIGTYNPNGNSFVRFTGKVVDNTIACGSNQLVNWVRATFSSSTTKDIFYEDDASVFVDKECNVTPPPTPDPDPTPDPTPTPHDLPNTGPATIATGVIGAGSMVTALGYYVASRKKLM